MDNAKLLKIQSRFLLFGGISMVFNLLVVILALCKRAEIDRNYQIDHRRFYESVQLGTSNYLNQVLHDNEQKQVEQRQIASNVKVVLCDLSTWSDYSGSRHAVVDGVKFGIGDYTDYGLVAHIEDGRVYIDGSEGVVILRRRPANPPKGGDARSAGAPPPADGGGEG